MLDSIKSFASTFFVTGDPMIYGADVSIVLASVAVVFVLTYFKLWGWLWREWITTVDHKKNWDYVFASVPAHVVPWRGRRPFNAYAISIPKYAFLRIRALQ